MDTSDYIPTRLDDQWKLGFWDIDVATPVLFSVFLGWMSGSKLGFAVLLALGISLARRFSRMKAERHGAFILHWAYWHLPPNPATALQCVPAPTLLRLVG